MSRWYVLRTTQNGDFCLAQYFFQTCRNSTLSILMSERPKQVSLFFEAAHFMSSEVIDILEFMSSTSVHSTATMNHWMKKTTNASFGIDKKELVQVALLQIHGGVSSVHFFLICLV